MSASGRAQWGPSVTRDFLGVKPSAHLIHDLVTVLGRKEDEFDLRSLIGLMKVATS